MKFTNKIKQYHKEIRNFQQKKEYNQVKSNQNLKIFHKDINIRNFIYEETVKMTVKLSDIKKKFITNKKSSNRKVVNSVAGIGLTAEELMIFYLEIYDDIILTKNLKDLETPHIPSSEPFDVTLFNSTTKTKLTSNIKYNYVIKRNLTSIKALRNHMSKMSYINQINTNSIAQTRYYASAHGGRIILPKKEIPKVTASSDNPKPVHSEMEYHSVALQTARKATECKKTNCAEGNAETNPCKVSGEAHRGPLFSQELIEAGIVAEVNGALTHTLPPGSEGTCISNTDMNGVKVDQNVMHEEGVIPIVKTQFKENEKKTEYLQDNGITHLLIANASKDSVMNSNNNNETTSTLHTKNNTSLNETL